MFDRLHNIIGHEVLYAMYNIVTKNRFHCIPRQCKLSVIDPTSMLFRWIFHGDASYGESLCEECCSRSWYYVRFHKIRAYWSTDTFFCCMRSHRGIYVLDISISDNLLRIAPDSFPIILIKKRNHLNLPIGSFETFNIHFNFNINHMFN